MSFAKMHTRKTMSFLTPQAKKTQSPVKTRLSLAMKNGNPEKLLGNLLKDPIKRALLMEVLSQDTREDPEKIKEKTKKPPKFKFESPSALCRRRALAKMQADSDSSDNTTSPIVKERLMKDVPFDQILKGVTAYVEIMSDNKDRSAGAKALMQAMGAKIMEVLGRNVTHVVFKDGSFKTFQKAKLLKVHLVSVLWIEAVHKNRIRVPEKNYPPLGAGASQADASFICKLFQQEYADVIQEELDKSKRWETLSLSTDDQVYTSQNEGPRINNVSKAKFAPLSLNSRPLQSTTEITSDSESDYHPQREIKKTISKTTQTSPEKRNGNLLTANPRVSKDEEISAGYVYKTPNSINVTQRKKKSSTTDSVNILSNVQITPPKQTNSIDNVKGTEVPDLEMKQLDRNLKTTIEPLRKVTRRLYSIDTMETSRKSNAIDNPPDFNVQTPSSSKINTMRTPHTLPRRRSTRLSQSDEGLLWNKKLESETGNSSDDFEETPIFLTKTKDRENGLASPTKGVKHYSPQQIINKQKDCVKDGSKFIRKLSKDSQDVNRNVFNNICPLPKQIDSYNSEIRRLNRGGIINEPPKRRSLYNSDEHINNWENSRRCSKIDSPRPINSEIDVKSTPNVTPRRKSTKFYQKGNYLESIDEETSLQHKKLTKEDGSGSSDDFELTPDIFRSSQRKAVKTETPIRDVDKSKSIKQTLVFKTPRRRSVRLKDMHDIKLKILSNVKISPARQTADLFSGVKGIEVSDTEIKQLDDSLMRLNCSDSTHGILSSNVGS